MNSPSNVRITGCVVAPALLIAYLGALFYFLGNRGGELITATLANNPMPDPSKPLVLLTSADTTLSPGPMAPIAGFVVLAIIILFSIATAVAFDDGVAGAYAASTLLLFTGLITFGTLVSGSAHAAVVAKANNEHLVTWSQQRYGVTFTEEQASTLLSGRTVYVGGKPTTATSPGSASQRILVGGDKNELPLKRR